LIMARNCGNLIEASPPVREMGTHPYTANYQASVPLQLQLHDGKAAIFKADGDGVYLSVCAAPFFETDSTQREYHPPRLCRTRDGIVSYVYCPIKSLLLRNGKRAEFVDELQNLAAPLKEDVEWDAKNSWKETP